MFASFPCDTTVDTIVDEFDDRLRKHTSVTYNLRTKKYGKFKRKTSMSSTLGIWSLFIFPLSASSSMRYSQVPHHPRTPTPNTTSPPTHPNLWSLHQDMRKHNTSHTLLPALYIPTVRGQTTRTILRTTTTTLILRPHGTSTFRMTRMKEEIWRPNMNPDIITLVASPAAGREGHHHLT